MPDFDVHDPRFEGGNPADPGIAPGGPRAAAPPVDAPRRDSPQREFSAGDLPPVEPPSAGFIMQLFVVPALIVLAVVAVWALFGKIATAEQDWRALVAELRGGNEHRRWRAALGLAQMLKGDQEKKEKGEGLARNPKVCGELTTLLKEQLSKGSSRKDDLKQQAFLARTLGFLDVPETVLPVLADALSAEHDIDVRRNALASISLILGRAAERGEHPASPELVDRLVESTRDNELQIRQLAVYALGLIPDETARQQLELLVGDDGQDATVRANAAVALSRGKSLAGLPYLKTILKDAAGVKNVDVKRYVDSVTLQNALRAVRTLKAELSDADRAELRKLIEPIAASYPDSRLQLDARETVAELR